MIVCRTQSIALMTLCLMPKLGAAEVLDGPARTRDAPEEIEVLRTNTAFLTPVGEIEIDVVPYTLYGANTQETGTVVELEYGFLEWLMFEMEVSALWLAVDQGPSVLGLGNIGVATKVLVLDKPVRVGLNTELNLPTATDDAFERRWGVEPSLVVSFSTWAFSAHIELGAEWNETDDWDELFGNAAVLIHPWNSDVAAALAVNFTHEEETRSFSLLPGILFDLDSLDVEIGFSAVVGLTPRGEDWGFIGDVEFEF